LRKRHGRSRKDWWSGLLAAAAVSTLVLGSGVGAASGAGPFLGGKTCLQPDAVAPEIYGPTDINAVTGNRRLTVAENAGGTLTVMRWPSPSYDNLLRYRTLSPALDRLGVDPNEGSLLGLIVGGRVRWLRDLTATQQHLDGSSDAVETRYHAPDLDARVIDVVDPARDALVRRVDVQPPGAASAVVGFAHFDPTLVHFPDFPTYDWCQQDEIVSSASYDPVSDAVVTGAPGVAIASGFARTTSGHQVGQDAYWTGSHTTTVPEDAYDTFTEGHPIGSSTAPGPQVDFAMETALDAGGGATLIVAAGPDAVSAAATLETQRTISVDAVLAVKRAQLAAWLAPCPLPAGGGPAVADLARRAYISAWQASDLRGPIVASIATQSPYGEDWVRDTSFIDHLLDLCGHHAAVAASARFLADVQVRAGRPPPLGTSPLVPPGNWAMNYYADGTVGGPIPWEIDETGFGVWTLVDHWALSGDRGYLEDVYPAVAAGADFLTGAGRDPSTGLAFPAIEDDNVFPTNPPTMHASGPVLLALRSAAAAATALGRADDATRWSGRATEVLTAIDQRYHAGPGGLAWTADYGDGGWALWPVEVEPQTSPRMRAQADAAAASVAPSFLAPVGPRKGGSYEAKALLGLALHDQAVGDATGLEGVRRGLQWIATVQATAGTHLLGESWVVRGGRVTTIVSQPHVWEMTLFTLAALQAWPPVAGPQPAGAAAAKPEARPAGTTALASTGRPGAVGPVGALGAAAFGLALLRRARSWPSPGPARRRGPSRRGGCRRPTPAPGA